MEITVKHGVCLIDDEDDWVLEGWWWHSQISTRQRRTIYMQGRVHTAEAAAASGLNDIGNLFPMHRLILHLPRYREFPFDVDHINGNGLDNRKENLRICHGTASPVVAGTRAQNLANTRGRGGSSRFKGVMFDKKTGLWKAQIMIDGKSRNLGRFENEEQAAGFYNLAAKAAWGSFAFQNPVPIPGPRQQRGSSRFRGVAFDSKRNAWIAQITVRGQNKYLGRYLTEEEAAVAYNRAAVAARGDLVFQNDVPADLEPIPTSEILRTHCRRNHELTEENIIRRSDRIECRACAYLTKANRRAKERAGSN